MPTYEYACEGCGKSWETEQRISEDPIKECPACGAPKAKRLISGGNFMLKGAGWYKDLYHKPAAKKSESSSSDSSGSSSSSDSTSSSSTSTSSDSKTGS